MTQDNYEVSDDPLVIVAKRFYERFAGLTRAYGRTRLTGIRTDKGKEQASCDTVREPLTIACWVKHLAGAEHLGVVPIRDDTTVRWGAIDIDAYKDFDLVKVADHVNQMALPLVVCRTKSGGAHLYCFTTEDVPAELMRNKLMEWAVALGHSGVEVFPKQIRLANTMDVGNWINMPYHGGDDTTRYAIAGTKRLNCVEFLEYADLLARSQGELELTVPSAVQQYREDFLDAPPCLESLAVRGFGEGTRNNSLFNIGVYLRKRFGDENWEDKLDAYNQKFMAPPLGSQEVQKVANQVKRKTYFFKCTDAPINMVCNKQICHLRKYGIGGGSNDPGVVFGSLQKVETDPPIWILSVDGANVELTTAELKDQGRLGSKCMELLNKLPNLMKPRDYMQMVQTKLQSVEIIPAPKEITIEGQVLSWLEEYLTVGPKALSKEDLLMNKPWTENGQTWFHGLHFKQWLSTQRVVIPDNQLWNILRKSGGKSKFINIKGKGRNFWVMKAFATQTEHYTVPELDPI